MYGNVILVRESMWPLFKSGTKSKSKNAIDTQNTYAAPSVKQKRLTRYWRIFVSFFIKQLLTKLTNSIIDINGTQSGCVPRRVLINKGWISIETDIYM